MVGAISPAALACLVPAYAAAQAESASASVRSSPAGEPRPLVHQYWGIRDGLPLSHVNSVLATRRGYVWLATYDGLVRFDGARFSIFNAANRPDLPTSRFVSVQEDEAGALWATAEFDHVVRFAGGRFDVFSLPDETRGGAIRELQFDGDGNAWVTTNRGLFSIEADGLRLASGTGGGPALDDLYLDPDGSVWLGTDGRGAVRWRDGRSEAFHGTTALGRVARGFAPAPAGGTYLALGNGVMEYRRGTLRRLSLPVEAPTVHDLLPLPGDSALVVADAGLFLIADGEVHGRDADIRPVGGPAFLVDDPSGGRWFATGGNLYRNGTLVFEGDFPIAGLTVDHEGSVWVAADGLHRFKPSVFDVLGDEQGALSNVYPIFEDSRGRVWIGGLSRGFGRFEEDGFRRLEVAGVPPLPQAIAEDGDGRTWVGGINYGGCVLRGPRCAPEDRFLTGHTIKAIYRDAVDAMWVGTDRGVYRDSAGVWTHFSTDDGLPHDLVRVVRQTSDGAVWFGTNGGGIARYSNGTIEALSTRSGFPSDLVRDIHELSPGVLLVGTEDSGLLRIALSEPSAPLSTAEVLVIDRRSGLYDDGIHSIVADGHGRLWMNTNRGIFWVLESQVEELAAGRRTGIRSIAYREGDGLSNPEGNGGVQSAAIRASDGKLWFAMQAGVAIVDPSRIEAPESPLPVLVEELRVEGGRAIPIVGGAEAPIVLAPGERDFEVDYTALGFLAPENLRFQYRLSGFQTEWVDAANRRTAFFTNVPPGDYTFEVRATREDGVWRPLEAPVRLMVRPFFHETAWFRSSVAASLLLLGLFGLRTRDRRRIARERRLEDLVSERTATIEAQAARLEEMDRAKSRFFANISHEFRTPLTLTIGPLEDLISSQHGELDPEQLAPVELSLRNSRRLLKLVNQLLEVARLEAKAVELQAEEADLVPFVGELVRAFAPLAERERIGTRVLAPDHPVPVLFDPDLLERVVLNLLSNAFKFTPEGGTVAVEVAERGEGWVAISVRDSGPGITEEQLPHLFDRFYQADPSQETSQPGTGIGLSLAHELVGLHHGRLEVDSDPGFGSTFTVWLRTGADHLAPEQLRHRRGPRSGVRPLVEEEVALLQTARRRVDDGSGRPTTEVAGRNGGGEGGPDDDVPTVLIVEDNVEVSTFVRNHLERKFRCFEARDGQAALALAREQLPDLVISDVMMPRMDGLELLEALRADRDLAYVPVLLLTAKAGQEHKLEGLGAGAAAYLTKPFDMAELETRVEGLIERQRALRERVRREALVHPSPPDMESSADRFLLKLRETIESNLGDEDFDVRALARAMSESRSSLYRHIHDLVGETPSQLLKRVRLERAEAMLAGGVGSIQEVAYAVGFKSVSHFSRSFREQYGVPPSRYTPEGE